MDNRKTNPFSQSVAENDYSIDANKKIQVVKCKLDGIRCKKDIAEINNNFLQSNNHIQNKDYRRAIESLETAFEGTFNIEGETCSKCANVFRNTIIETLTNYQSDLKSMSTGIFRKKRFIVDYELAGNVLNKFRNQQNPKRKTKVIKLQKFDEKNADVFAHASSGI